MNTKTEETPLYVNLNYNNEVIRLAQNENPYGASPKVLEAIQKNIKSVSLYPDVILTELKEKLSIKNNVSPNEIIVAPGSCALIAQLISRLVKSDENVVISKLSFIAYKLCAKIYNRECREAEMENYHVSLKNILSLTDVKTKLIFIANPNNPTGTFFTKTELLSFLKEIPPTTYVVLDDAYNEYVTAQNFPDVLTLYRQYKNIIILHSFSKIYGLAGLRIGYGIMQKPIIDDFEANRVPFSVNSIANIAVLAALDDIEYLQKCASENAKEREFLINKLRMLEYNVIESQSNFIFLYFSTTEKRDNVYDVLFKNKIVVRKMDTFGDNKAFRISIGKPEENKKIVECLTTYNK